MPHRLLPALAFALLANLAPLTGCQSTYRDKGNFVPHPAEAVSTMEPRVRTLASVIGIRNADREAGLPLSVEVRMQIENRGESPLRIDPASLRLTSGDLRAFGPALLDAEGPIEAAPGQVTTVTAHFPFPEGKPDKVDLNGLNLQWTVAAGANRLAQSVTFTRRMSDAQRHRDRGPHFGVGFGIGTVID